MNDSLAKPGIELPYLVGPDVYVVYADSSFTIATIIVNGSEIINTSSTGNMSLRRGSFSASGESGKAFQQLINGFLKPGKNTIKVVFGMCPIAMKAIEDDAVEDLFPSMYGHVVLTEGRLNDSDMGIESHTLDTIVKDTDIEILDNKLLRRFYPSSFDREVSTEYTLDVPVDNFRQATPSDISGVEIKVKGEKIKGTLTVNDNWEKNIRFGGARSTSTPLYGFVDGENTIKLKIEELENITPGNVVDIFLSVDLSAAKKKIEWNKDEHFTRFGDWFHERHIYLGSISYDSSGEYELKTNIKLK